MNERALELIEKLDCITIFSGLGTPVDFRLKAKGDAIELATREGKFFPDWQGFVDTDCYPPVLHLTKLNGISVNKALKIPEPENGIRRIMVGLGHIFVTFIYHV
ncbi:hypothetical protein J7K42_01290 [bacterium]|nr:hypothetical protein [bacterium]